MAIRTLAVLLLLVRPAAALTFKTVDTFTVKGAHGLILIPDNWNGGLFIYAHGYTADARFLKPFPADLTLANIGTKLDTLVLSVLIPTLSGYASATSTFRSVGWDVDDAIKDIENVRRRFVEKYGKPKYTYLWGHSEGGMITSTVIEYLPHTYDGALPMCGPGAGARRNFNGAFDLRVVYEYVCRDVPEARFLCRMCSDGRSRCLADGDCPAGQSCGAAETPGPINDGLTRQCTDFLLAHPDRFSESTTAPGGGFVTGPVAACFGGATPSCARSRSRPTSLPLTCSSPRSASPRSSTTGRTAATRGATSGSLTRRRSSTRPSRRRSIRVSTAPARMRRRCGTCVASTSRAGGRAPR